MIEIDLRDNGNDEMRETFGALIVTGQTKLDHLVGVINLYEVACGLSIRCAK